MQTLSFSFQQLYCDPAVFDVFSARHPISFKSALPFQSQDRVIDDPYLIDAEFAYLTEKNNLTRRAVIDAYARCGLMSPSDTANVMSAIDFFDTDFFDLMGLVYANTGMYICALRWYREHIVALEAQDSRARSDLHSVYASVGYCLYSLGMFAEAVAWTKSCIGPALVTHTASRAFLESIASQMGGRLLAIERSVNDRQTRARYTLAVPNPPASGELSPRLKSTLEALAPHQETHLGCVSPAAPRPPVQEGYPFRIELDNGNFLRHKMNLLFALCSQADALIANACFPEARRLLSEAALLEPNAHFIQERIQALP